MNRRYLLLTVIGLVSMLAGILLFNLLQPDSTSRVKTSAQSRPELHAIPLTELDGRQTTISDWQGDILVVNFWAPWCAPCRREVPTLIEVSDSFRHQGVRVLGIAYDGEDQVRRFADEYQIDYPLFLAGNRTAMYNAAFGNQSGSLPFTVLLNRDQQIVFSHHGEVTSEQLRNQLEALI